MTPTLTREPPPVAAGTLRLPEVIAAVLGLVVLLAATTLAGGPRHVARLSVENPSVHRVTIELAGESGGVVPLGAVDREKERTFADVPDFGDRWTFRFSGGGLDGGALVVDRDDLEAGDWHVRVPADVADRLAAAGLPPGP